MKYELLFFPFVLLAVLIYYFVPKKYRWIVLIVTSIAFYAVLVQWWVFLLIGMIIVVFLLGILIEYSRNNNKEALTNFVLVIGIILATLPLLFFKYYEPFLSQLNKWFGTNIPIASFTLLIGLSFYTFNMIGYIVDIRKGEITAQKNIFHFMTYVCYFPHIMQGPIPSYKETFANIIDGHVFEKQNIVQGTYRILYGLFLKLAIANLLSLVVNPVFSNYSDYSGTLIFVSTLFYSVELYCDFSGFISIMLGVSLLFGIKLNENFDKPFLATTIAGFWRRWHISLTKWLTKYIYIPLGGSKVGVVRWILNVFIVFIVSGIWHGVGVGFIIWGCIHAFYQVVGKFTMPVREKLLSSINLKETDVIVIIIRRVICFILVSLAWVPFIKPDIVDIGNIYARIFSNINFSFVVDGTISSFGGGYLMLLVVLLACISSIMFDKLYNKNDIALIHGVNVNVICCFVLMIFAIVFSYMYFISLDVADSQFIYFSF